jgi:hypothetical protein
MVGLHDRTRRVRGSALGTLCTRAKEKATGETVSTWLLLEKRPLGRRKTEPAVAHAERERSRHDHELYEATRPVLIFIRKCLAV